MNDCEKVKREMTFEEEATLYEREARDMFSKEEGSSEDSGKNNLVRRGMRIIRKSRETIASLQKFVDHIGTLSTCNDCIRSECEYKPRWGEIVRYNCPLYLKLDTPNEEKPNMQTWAEKEIEIACKREQEASGVENDGDTVKLM